MPVVTFSAVVLHFFFKTIFCSNTFKCSLTFHLYPYCVVECSSTIYTTEYINRCPPHVGRLSVLIWRRVTHEQQHYMARWETHSVIVTEIPGGPRLVRILKPPPPRGDRRELLVDVPAGGLPLSLQLSCSTREMLHAVMWWWSEINDGESCVKRLIHFSFYVNTCWTQHMWWRK